MPWFLPWGAQGLNFQNEVYLSCLQSLDICNGNTKKFKKKLQSRLFLQVPHRTITSMVTTKTPIYLAFETIKPLAHHFLHESCPSSSSPYFTYIKYYQHLNYLETLISSSILITNKSSSTISPNAYQTTNAKNLPLQKLKKRNHHMKMQTCSSHFSPTQTKFIINFAQIIKIKFHNKLNWLWTRKKWDFGGEI